MKRWAAGIVVLGLIAYLATGVSVIQQDEIGVVRRLGAVLAEPWEPGLHWGLPWGLDQLDRVKPGQTRTLSVGVRDVQAAPLAQAPNPESDDFLTGDLNLVAQAIVQYRVLDPVAYLFAARRCDEALAVAAESSLTRTLAERAIDDVLTTGRAEVAERILRTLQKQADAQGLGVSIRAVRLGRVAPPVPVAPAFADAARARSDLRQALTRAEEYSERAETDARGQSREIADRAAARFERLVQRAKGEADRFTKVLAESRKDLDATRRRLYLEALATILPRFSRKIVVAAGQDLDVSLIAEDKGGSANGENVGKTRNGLLDFVDLGMKRLLAGALTVVLMGLLGWSATRRSSVDREARPASLETSNPIERAFSVLLQDAWDGNVSAYLAAFDGPIRNRLEREVEERGRETFAADLRRARARKSHAVFSPDADGDDTARITVETVYPDRNERQTYRLDRAPRGWLVTEVETIRSHQPKAKYGTPASYQEPEGPPVQSRGLTVETGDETIE